MTHGRAWRPTGGVTRDPLGCYRCYRVLQGRRVVGCGVSATLDAPQRPREFRDRGPYSRVNSLEPRSGIADYRRIIGCISARRRSIPCSTRVPPRKHDIAPAPSRATESLRPPLSRLLVYPPHERGATGRSCGAQRAFTGTSSSEGRGELRTHALVGGAQFAPPPEGRSRSTSHQAWVTSRGHEGRGDRPSAGTGAPAPMGSPWWRRRSHMALTP